MRKSPRTARPENKVHINQFAMTTYYRRTSGLSQITLFFVHRFFTADANIAIQPDKSTMLRSYAQLYNSLVRAIHFASTTVYVSFVSRFRRLFSVAVAIKSFAILPPALPPLHCIERTQAPQAIVHQIRIICRITRCRRSTMCSPSTCAPCSRYSAPTNCSIRSGCAPISRPQTAKAPLCMRNCNNAPAPRRTGCPIGG